LSGFGLRLRVFDQLFYQKLGSVSLAGLGSPWTLACLDRFYASTRSLEILNFLLPQTTLLAYVCML
jgi:hypothetical protein